MLFPERFSCSITFSSFSKFLFGIPCTFTFVFLPSISVLEILLFNFQRSCAHSLPEVAFLSGRAFLFYYLPPFLSRGFFNFFRDFKKRRAAANRLFFPSVRAFFDRTRQKATRKRKKSAVFQRIIAQKTCTFLFGYDIMKKSVSVDSPTDRYDPDGIAYRSPSLSRRGKGEFGWTNK